MLRITEKLENEKTVRLRLDGTISVESLSELDEACARFRDRQLKMIILDMAGVDFMKDDAARKLGELLAALANTFDRADLRNHGQMRRCLKTGT